MSTFSYPTLCSAALWLYTALFRRNHEATGVPAIYEREKTWVRLARGGDPDAFRYLVERYQDRAYETAFRVVRSKEDAEDVTQAAFLRAWKALPAFREEARFSTWLYQIVTRCALDAVRKSKRLGERETALENDHLESLSGPERITPPPTDLMRLEIIIDKLNPEQRAVVTLFYLRDLPVREIGETLGLPDGTVKTHLHRSRSKLRQLWISHGGRI